MERYRRSVNNMSVTFETNIEFYTAITFALMNWSQATVVIPHHAGLCRQSVHSSVADKTSTRHVATTSVHHAGLWTRIMALGALLRSSDYFGSQRALGATFFTLCQFSPQNFRWFNDLGGAGDALLQVHVVITSSPSSSAAQETLSYRYTL